METNKASSFIGKSITLNSSKILPVIDRLKNLKMFNLLPYNKANNQKGLTYSIEAKLIKKFETLEKFSYSITETSSVQALNYFDQNNSKQDNVLTWYDNLLEKSSSILLLRLCQLLSYKDTDLTKQYIENNPNSIYENQLKTANMIYSDIQLEAETNKDFKPILKVIAELEKVYSEIKDDKIECQQKGINLDELDFENQILRMANFTAQNWDLKLKTLESPLYMNI